METPEHEQLKLELIDKFDSTKTYLGSFIKKEIQQTNFKQLRRINKPTVFKKGDVILVKDGVKTRPAVLIKQIKGGWIFIPLTSSENIHCLTESKSRFFKDGYFSKAVNFCTDEYAVENFVGIYDNPKLINKAIKELKNFLNENL